MPRETIKTKDHNFDIKVGWSKDHDVQVGVSEAEDRSLWWVYGNKYTDVIGAEVIKIVKIRTLCEDKADENRRVGEDVLNLLDATCGAFYELWATMDRNEINQLIKVLRRARDSAFGRDE